MPSPYDSLPPLPAPGERGPHVCEIIRLYLAVLPDLSLMPAQQAIIDDHLRICASCTEEQRLLNESERLLADLSAVETTPSARVDQAVMAAIAAREAVLNRGNEGSRAEASSAPTSRETNPTDRQLVGAKLASALVNTPTSGRSTPTTIGSRFGQRRRHKRRRGRLVVLISQLAVAAIFLLALLATIHFATGVLAPATTFALPANLTWNDYVLYHTQTKTDAQGKRYQVLSYHELSSGNMHVETVMPGQMDVVVVKAGQQMIGKDMMHHVAQMDPQGWLVDDSAFDLAALKSDLQAHRAIYEGKDTFHGQIVYRVRLPDGLVLLLDMHYQPVNVLQGASGSPVYDTLRLIPVQQVPDSMWWTQVPAGFHMGTLPPGP